MITDEDICSCPCHLTPEGYGWWRSCCRHPMVPPPDFTITESPIGLILGGEVDWTVSNVRFRRRWLDSISTRDWIALLRFYRILRIRTPMAAPGDPAHDGQRSQGCSYGLSRDEAKAVLFNFARELDWYEYLGSK